MLCIVLGKDLMKKRGDDFVLNTSDNKFLHDRFILDFIDSNCSSEEYDSDEYDKSIQTCYDMIDNFKAENNKKEVKFWRNQLQKLKTEKRILRKLIDDNTNRKELLTT